RSELADHVKQIFQQHCYECHRYDVARGGIKILHHRLLVTVRKVIVPGQPEESELFQLLTTTDPTDSPSSSSIRRPPYCRTDPRTSAGDPTGALRLYSLVAARLTSIHLGRHRSRVYDATWRA
ncbi:MAG: hypothetical protein IID40_09945, partial [Planctomycetes bacterium]|nr:hypothetical protein [Planctomycetota bacterium]